MLDVVDNPANATLIALSKEFCHKASPIYVCLLFTDPEFSGWLGSKKKIFFAPCSRKRYYFMAKPFRKRSKFMTKKLLGRE